MARIARGAGRMLAGLIVLLVLVWFFAPREPVDTAVAFDPASIGPDPAAYLAAEEARVPGIRPDASKRIVWAGASGDKTPLSVLYVHGFSASAEEIRPVPDDVAAALGANLVFTRLRGHGRDGPAMAEARVADWIHDVAEALAVARRAGERVIVIATSTGGTLAALAARDPALSRDVAGIVFVSPNFGVGNPSGFLLTWPLARYWVPLIVGRERSFEAMNDRQAAAWTTRYPTVATIPMAAMVRYAVRQDYANVTIPALFLFSDADAVVRAAATREVAARWGGPVTLAPQDLPPGNDPYNHVIAGDILSPGMNAPVTAAILSWAGGL